MVDVEGFKSVNDTFGREAGDALLRQIGERLAREQSDGGLVARVSGDRFAIALPGADGVAPGAVEHALVRWFGAPFSVGAAEIAVAARMGLALFPADGTQPDALLTNAESALKKAKAAGERWLAYAPEMSRRVAERMALETELRRALERQEFVLHYQPKIELDTRRVAGLEALLRWRHPEQGLVAPLRFIPLAEESGLIVPIGEWVLRTACAQMKAWQDAGIAPRRMAVNLSARQFRQKHLLQHIEEILRATGLEPKYLELEITESMVMEDPGEAVKLLGQLSDLGVTLAIDDFGTGYSSLSYLKRFPVDFLKIDRSFVREVPQNADDVAIARTIIALARGLGLRVIAEGVETERQRNFLEMEGCEEAQGYLLGKPAEAQDVERLLREPYAR
jgi:diguanylate cyclase (GGDEF)-like protein